MRAIHFWIIEDNAPDVFLVNMAMEKAQLPVMTTVITDGEDALTKLASCGDTLPAPDLLLVDLHLPKTSGAELLRAVQKHPLVSRSCLAVFSSLPAPSPEVVLRPTDRYIQKSSHLEEFVTRIVDWASSCTKHLP